MHSYYYFIILKSKPTNTSNTPNYWWINCLTVKLSQAMFIFTMVFEEE